MLYADSNIRAHSASFSETLATGIQLPGYMENMQGFTVSSVPDQPYTLVLAGLGLSALSAYSGKKSLILPVSREKC
jgi:hypothetical protein